MTETPSNKQMRSQFRAIFVMGVLMLIGAALIFKVDTAIDPRPKQGKTLTVTFSWQGAPAKVVEQNVTSVVEGLVSSVRDVARTESTSRFGSGSVKVELKPEADVSAVKFEIASLMRQMKSMLPEGASYPVVTGGEVVNESRDDKKTVTLLTYRIVDDLPTNVLREYVKNRLEPAFASIDEVTGVDVNGGTEKYLEVSYDPAMLARYGITSAEISEAVRWYIGEKGIIGEVDDEGGRMALWLDSDGTGTPLEHLAVRQSGPNGKTVYLNDIARCVYKYKEPNDYYRINGMNTVYVNVKAQAGTNLISLSDRVQRKVEEVERSLSIPVGLELTYDSAERQRLELGKLVSRSLLSLLILMALVLAVSRSVRYFAVVGITLAAALLISVIAYYLLDIRLHIFSLAGITVSLGLIIDAVIVMVDHYGRYRDRGAFFAILAALLTTIGSLVLIFFMPDYIQDDLHDFALIVMVNLTVALLVAYLFAPALVDALMKRSGRKRKRRRGSRRWSRLTVRLTRVYARSIMTGRRFRWLVTVLLVFAFGLPLFAFPKDWEFPYRKELTVWLGGTLRMFADCLDSNTYSPKKEEMKLHIIAQMPLGGTATQLNEKVLALDEFLKTQDGIKRWTTNVGAWGATVEVEFTPEALKTSLPYNLENRVIGRVIDIGGADWATYGVSERGFSNSLNLSYRSSRIMVKGYNYERLVRIAETICDTLQRNPRVADIAVQTPGYENQEDELFVKYDREQMALYGITAQKLHSALGDLLSTRRVGVIDDGVTVTDVMLRPESRETFDLWSLGNSYIRIDSADYRVGDFVTIGRREAKNVIEKRDQQYVLNVAFNVIGSYTYTSKYIEGVVDTFSRTLPVGFSCEVATYGWYQDTGEQYWLLIVVVLIIYMLCGILFESWTRPFVIILLIPVSFIGVFLTFRFTGIPFGTGGFASLVLLCGITVNAAIYILNEYDRLTRLYAGRRGVDIYVKAFSRKIVAVILTVVSTIAGLIPFLLDGPEEKFWYSFAVGTISGLTFSLLVLVLVMPLYMRLPTAAKLSTAKHAESTEKL